MERAEKEYAMLRFATCLVSFIEDNKLKAKETGDGKIRKSDFVTSLRKLAAHTVIDYATIQKIATGKKNPAWSTAVALIEGLGISLKEWGARYDSVTDKEIADLKNQSKLQKPSAKKSSKKR